MTLRLLLISNPPAFIFQFTKDEVVQTRKFDSLTLQLNICGASSLMLVCLFCQMGSTAVREQAQYMNSRSGGSSSSSTTQVRA